MAAGVGIDAVGVGVLLGLGVLVAAGVFVGLGVLVATGVGIDAVGVSVVVVGAPLTVVIGVGVSDDALGAACSSESDCEHANTTRTNQLSAQKTGFV